MIKTVKKTIKKILKREYVNSEEYIEYLRDKGIVVGTNCYFYDTSRPVVDTQNPGMVHIGNNVRITEGVQILTHDYSFSVMCSLVGDIVGSVEPVFIGNNVFIGRNAIILKGVSVGNNVIIGAGAVVTKDCDDNSVYAGNPAKRICSIEELYKKRKSKQLENAKKVALTYYNTTGKKPDEMVLREYQLLFTNRSTITTSIAALMRDSGCEDLCKDYYMSSSPEFDSLEAFLNWCGIK